MWTSPLNPMTLQMIGLVGLQSKAKPDLQLFRKTSVSLPSKTKLSPLASFSSGADKGNPSPVCRSPIAIRTTDLPGTGAWSDPGSGKVVMVTPWDFLDRSLYSALEGSFRME